VGGEDGAPYIIMEYIRGRTLKETLDAGGPLREQRAVAIMAPILDALGYAHRQGLIHRDVKPHNILLTTDGTPRLADFGIAHLVDGSTTRTAAILGSAQYLSPEQSRGEEATDRSDIYACGIVLYEMLAGRPPFNGMNALAVANQHLNSPPPPLTELAGPVSPELERTILRALAKEPSKRFADTAEMQAALQHPNMGTDGTTTAITSLEATELIPTDATAIVPLNSPPASVSEAGARTLVGRRPDMILRRSARKTALFGVLLAALVAGLAFAAQLTVSGYSLPAYPSTPYALFPGACAIVVVLSWLNARSWRYTMDGDAAVVQWGLLSHHRFGVPIRNITTLELKQSPLDRVIGVGTVELCARDQHGRERRVVMEDLPHPRETYEDLMRHLGRSARDRG
jgi:membrane protein YdbS with pleckstrin-like domain